MKTQIFTCDICKQSKSENDLASISITTRGITITKNHYHPALSVDICPDCLKKKGFVVNPKEENITEEEAVKKNEKTLENKFLEILEDLGVQFYE